LRIAHGKRRMVKRARKAAWALAALLCSVGVVWADLPEPLDAAQFRAHYQALTRDAHRLSGTPEAGRAAAYIEAELRKLPGRFLSQRFVLPQQIVTVCELRAAAGRVPLRPLFANGMQPSVLPKEGFEGRILSVGKGTHDDIRGKSLRDAIVGVAFDTEGAGGVGMVTLFRLGARAVIFVGDLDDRRDDVTRTRTSVSVDLPRFYIPREEAERHGLFGAKRGALHSQVRWEKRFGRNLFLWIEGSQPVIKSKGKPEILILSAPYDTGGLVPHKSPGQAGAANCAALLSTAARLARNRPRRSVLVTFFDGHANFLQGGRKFYAAFRRGMGKKIGDPLTKRKQFVKEERQYLTGMVAFLVAGGLAKADDDPRRARALLLLRDESKYRYDDYQERLSDARLLGKEFKDELRASAWQASAYEKLAKRLQSELDGLPRQAMSGHGSLTPKDRVLVDRTFSE